MPPSSRESSTCRQSLVRLAYRAAGEVVLRSSPTPSSLQTNASASRHPSHVQSPLAGARVSRSSSLVVLLIPRHRLGREGGRDPDPLPRLGHAVPVEHVFAVRMDDLALDRLLLVMGGPGWGGDLGVICRVRILIRIADVGVG